MDETRDETATRSRPPPAAGGRGLLRRFWPILLVLAVAAGLYAAGAFDWLRFETLVTHRSALRGYVADRPALAALLYVGFYVLMVTLSLPGAWWISVSGGFLFGWLAGGALAVASAVTGAILVFLIARSSFGASLARRAGPLAARFADGFRKDAFFYLLFLRLVPVMPFWLSNIAPALFGVRLRTFAAATAIGIVPVTFAFATAGSGLDAVIAARQAAAETCRAAGRGDCAVSIGAGDLVTPELVAAIAVLGLVSLVPIVARRLGLLRFGAAGAD